MSWLPKKINLHLLVLAGYVVLALGMTWPVVGQLTNHVAGSGGDPWQTMWRFEHKAELLKQAVQTNNLTRYIAEEFFGRSEPHLINLSVWPWMWIYAIFGQPVAYNLIWLLSFVLSGYAMFLLVRTLVSSSEPMTQAAAFIAGMLYMFVPYHVAHSYGHFGAMQLQWIPFIITLAIVLLRRPTLWKALALSVLLITQAWTEHHYIVWLGVFALVAAIYYRAHLTQQLRHKGVARHVGVSLVIAAFFISFSYLPTVRLALQDNSSLNLGYEQLVRFSADPFAYIAPAAFHTIWGSLVAPLYREAGGFTGNISEATQFLGFVSLLLIAFFHQQLDKRTKWFWAIVAVVFLGISLGPQLHIFGTVTALPLPYALFDELPGLSSIRAVARAGVMVAVAISVLFGLVLATQLKRRGSAVLVGLAVLIECLFFPVPTQSTKLSQAYDQVAADTGKVVLEIPAATNYVIASRSLYASNRHRKEVLGNIALERAATEDEFTVAKQLPGVRQLLLLRTTELREDRSEFFGQALVDSLLDAMDYLQASSVIIHTDSLTVLQNSAIETFLTDAHLTPREYDDVKVFTKGPTQHGDGVLLMREGGWANIGFDETRNSVFAEIPQTALALLANTTQANKAITITFTLPPENMASGVVSIDGNVVASFQSSGTVTIPYTLSAGEHQMTIEAKEGHTLIIQNPILTVQSR